MKKSNTIVGAVAVLVGSGILSLNAFGLDNLTPEQEIQQLYLAYLGRPADLAGMNYWAGQVESGLITLDQLRLNLVNEQPEYLENYGQLGNKDLTDTVYLNLFNRQSDLDGRDYWVNQLEQNLLLPDQLIVAFINGASEPDQLVLTNKLFIAECQTSGITDYDDDTLADVLASASSSTLLDSCPADVSAAASTFTPMEIVQVPATGGIAGDSGGVTITVEADTLLTDQSVRLVASAATGELTDEIQQYYSLESAFYSVSIEGEEDAPGRVLLQFPAASSDLRLAKITDGKHFSLLPFEPVDGKLNALAPLASEINPTDPGLNIRMDDSLQLAVVRPSAFTLAKLGQDKSQPSPAYLQPASVSFSCTNDGPFNWCVSDSNKIQVAWSSQNYSISQQTAGVIINEVQRALDAYKTAGIAYADIPLWSWTNIVLESGRTDGAEFSSNTGDIYIGNDSIITTADSNGELRLSAKARQNLWHELFHYLQDFTYPMKFARLSGDRSWWIEVTGEYAPALVDPALLGESARITGTTTNEDGAPFGIQMAPFSWQAGSAGYIHAQLLKVNTCDNSFNCALTPQQFADAINNGEYPFRSAGKQSEMLGSVPMSDYMRYLLGASPLTTNSTIPIADSIANGTVIGEMIYARQNPVGSGKFTLYPIETYFTPRVTRSSDTQLDIAAIMGPGAAYHARISNDNKPPNFQSARSGTASWPLSLKVQAPTPVSYRTGTTDAQGVTTYSEVKTHSGSDDLIIAPINQTMGVSVVRIAANNSSTSNDTTLNATVALVDLAGYWRPELSSVTTDSVQCLDTSVAIADKEQLLTDILAYAGSTGKYEQQPSPEVNKLKFTTDSNAASPASFNNTGEAVIGSDSITLTQSSSFEERFINSILYENALLETTLILDKLTYHQDYSASNPLWTMTGTGTTRMTLDIQGRNDQGINTSTTCTGTIQFTAAASIFESLYNDSPAFPGEDREGSFTISSYYNFDGSIGLMPPIDPSIPDVKLSGSGERPVISWNRSDVVSVLVASGNILYHIVGGDNDEDEFVYIQTGLQYGDYSRDFTSQNPDALNPSPNLSDDGTEYLLTINTDNPAQPFAFLMFRVNPP